MKKNDLIKLLSELKGNPEVVLWNGFVGDYMNIKGLEEGHLTKQSRKSYIEACEFEVKRDRKDFDYKFSLEDVEQAKRDYRKYIGWEYNEYIFEDQIEKGNYISKRVVYIEAKSRGINTFDRAGGISY